MAVAQRPVVRIADGRRGGNRTVYLYDWERERVDQLAREMNWPRGRTINALIAATVPETRVARAVLAEQLIAAEESANGDR